MRVFESLRRFQGSDDSGRAAKLALRALSECQKGDVPREELGPFWVSLCEDPLYCIAAFQGLRKVSPLAALRNLRLVLRFLGPGSTDIAVILRGIAADMSNDTKTGLALRAALREGLKGVPRHQLEVIGTAVEAAFGAQGNSIMDEISTDAGEETTRSEPDSEQHARENVTGTQGLSGEAQSITTRHPLLRVQRGQREGDRSDWGRWFVALPVVIGLAVWGGVETCWKKAAQSDLRAAEEDHQASIQAKQTADATVAAANLASVEAESAIDKMLRRELGSLVPEKDSLNLDDDTVRFTSLMYESSWKLAQWSGVVKGTTLAFKNDDFSVDEYTAFSWPDADVPKGTEVFRMTARKSCPPGECYFRHRVASRTTDLSGGKYKIECQGSTGNGKKVPIPTDQSPLEASERIGRGGGDVRKIPIPFEVQKGAGVTLSCSINGNKGQRTEEAVSGLYFDPRQYNRDGPVDVTLHLLVREKIYAISPRYDEGRKDFDLKNRASAALTAPGKEARRGLLMSVQGQGVHANEGVVKVSPEDPSWPGQQLLYRIEFEKASDPVVVFFRRMESPNSGAVRAGL